MFSFFCFVFGRIGKSLDVTFDFFKLPWKNGCVSQRRVELVKVWSDITFMMCYRAKIPSVTDASAPRFHQFSPNYKYQQLLSFMAV